MYIFILSILVVSFISACFYKKKFWENRYIVLLISGLVALFATLTTNYAMRSDIPTKTKVIWEKPIQMFFVNDSLINDSVMINFNDDLGLDDYVVKSNDTLTSKTSTSILIYCYKNLIKIGYLNENSNYDYEYLDSYYIAPSTADSIMYIEKKRLYYNPKSNKWVANFSLPYIKTIKCFYIPPTQYAMIPDSLITKLPF